LWKALTNKRRRNETLPIINKPKHPKKGGIQGTKWQDPCPRRQRTTQDAKPQREHQISKPSLVVISISNRERGGPPERTPSLEKPSPTATSRLKIKIVYTCNNTIDTL
jgi:hypothetical protein